MDATALKYQSSINIGGGWYSCVESYDSILDRLRDTAMKFQGSEEDGERAQWFQPLELTIQAATHEGADARPTRIAVAAQALVAIIDVPEEDRLEVQGS